MRALVGLVFAVPLCFSTISFAQQGLTGTYAGSFPAAGKKAFMQQVALEIQSAEGGKLSGKFTTYAGACSGVYRVEGSYQDDKLEMLVKEGSVAGCANNKLVLSVQGNKLVGKIDATELQLTRK